ncbi:hypothetical protein EX895_002902 [Sporisorium graminicola]|uniref:WW domain-containing protein n=1 Tax=Sporisorium graminicola TaxID=280036 RepID=A0A4U7KZ72_9BASI|nr:hypothetical protein EX895_002902 [Sporisorium graminicola]TKY88192.1 hypothetical protein EX895_002902 [Sporisorium graminicola]
MVSFAETDEERTELVDRPKRQRKQALKTASTISTVEADEESTSETTSTTSSHPTSHTSTTTTSPRQRKSTSASTTNLSPTLQCSPSLHVQRHIFASVSAGASKPTDWGANFWCVVTDPFAPANTFFANPTTGECRWVLPAGTMVLPPSPDGEWWELFDESTGREYYYHTRTEESRWTRPLRGMVIPMAAIQRAGHVAEKSGGQREQQERSEVTDADVGKRHWLAVECEDGQEERYTTPLRPRTRSLPKTYTRRKEAVSRSQSSARLHRLASEQILTAGRTGKTRLRCSEEQNEEDLAQRARKLILLHDQKALEYARRTSGPPFRPDPTSSSKPQPPTLAHRRKKPSTTLRMHPSPRTSTTPETPAAPSPAITIQKLGKGLAFNPSTPCSSSFSTSHHTATIVVKARRSLSFLSRQYHQRGGSSKRDRVALPGDLAAALLDVPVGIGSGRRAEENKRNSRLEKWIHCFAPCRRSAAGESASVCGHL